MIFCYYISDTEFFFFFRVDYINSEMSRTDFTISPDDLHNKNAYF